MGSGRRPRSDFVRRCDACRADHDRVRDAVSAPLLAGGDGDRRRGGRGTGVNATLAIVCAWLQETIEDAPTTLILIENRFGPAVARGVAALSKRSTLMKAELRCASRWRDWSNNLPSFSV